MTSLIGVLKETAGGTAAVSFDHAYPTAPGELWDAVTDPQQLERWFARVEGELREGGHFTIHFDNGDAPRCHVFEYAPQRQFAFEWPAPNETLVTVTVMPDGKGSRLRLRHENLTRTTAPRFAAGWDAYLHALADHLSGRPRGDWEASFDAVKGGYRAQLPL